MPVNVTTTELKDVYEEKFAKDKTAGRIYYDKIKEQAERSICPICGVRIVSTLDHYLPKSKNPTLAVTPDNLFPSCKDCNIDKKTDMVLDPQSTPVHLYYDRLPDDPWLHVNVGTNLEITYYISCPESWEEALRGRVEKHLDIYHLHKLYSAHASSEIEDKRHMWKKLFALGSENGTRGLVIIKSKNEITISNPGGFRIDINEAKSGGVSDPRNGALIKMFNLINIGERAGSGIPNIYSVWHTQGWQEPTITESFAPERITLTLSVGKKPTEKTDRKKLTEKTRLQRERIVDYLTVHVSASRSVLADLLGVKDTRAKEILGDMISDEILDTDGIGRNTVYKLKEKAGSDGVR